MTITLSPQPLADGIDVESESEVVETDHTRADVHELAALLAQAYVAMPLFP